MDVVVCVPGHSLTAHRDRATCIGWCNDEGWQITAFAGSRAGAERALVDGTAEAVVVAREAHRRDLRGLPVLVYPAPARDRTPVAAVPLIWLGDRLREHPVVAAALAGIAAAVAVVAWLLLPAPERDQLLLPPPVPPPVTASPSPFASPSPSRPEATGRPDPPATAGPVPSSSPPDDQPAAPPPAPSPAEPTPSPEPAGSPSPSNRPPEQLPTPDPEPVCIMRLDLLGIHYSVCLSGQP